MSHSRKLGALLFGKLRGDGLKIAILARLEAGRTFQFGEGWHSNENAVRFGLLAKGSRRPIPDAMPTRQHMPR